MTMHNIEREGPDTILGSAGLDYIFTTIKRAEFEYPNGNTPSEFSIRDPKQNNRLGLRVNVICPEDFQRSIYLNNSDTIELFRRAGVSSPEELFERQSAAKKGVRAYYIGKTLVGIQLESS